MFNDEEFLNELHGMLNDNNNENIEIMNAAKQIKLLFDSCVQVGFTEEQALQIVIGMLQGANKEE